MKNNLKQKPIIRLSSRSVSRTQSSFHVNFNVGLVLVQWCLEQCLKHNGVDVVARWNYYANPVSRVWKMEICIWTSTRSLNEKGPGQAECGPAIIGLETRIFLRSNVNIVNHCIINVNKHTRLSTYYHLCVLIIAYARIVVIDLIHLTSGHIFNVFTAHTYRQYHSAAY